MPYQRNPNDFGAAWEKTSAKGNTFLSVRLDVTHSPETAKALANMLLSGQPITIMASYNTRFDPNNPKVPKYSLYMPQPQHTWTLQAYNQVYAPNAAPKFDYKNPTYQPADYGQQGNYSAPPSQPPPPQDGGLSESPGASGVSGGQPTPPYPPTPHAQGATPPPPSPTPPHAPGAQPSASPTPQNPFGA